MHRAFPFRLAGFAAALALAPLVLAQAPPSEPKAKAALDQRILADAKHGSQIIKNLTFLSDSIGPRLTGSANLQRACDWGASVMKEYGLTNVHKEAWTIPEGWQRGPAYARLIEPDTGRSISIASMGWAPGTPGKVVGNVVIIKAQTIEELDAYKGKLKNAIVLSGAPAKLRPLADMTKPGGGPGFGGKKLGGKGKRPFEQVMSFQKARGEFLRKEGAAAIFQDSQKHFGLLNMTGSWQGKDRASATSRIPTVFVAHNHYEMLWRLASRPAPARTRLELDIQNTFVPGPIKVYNVVGEIKGTDKSDELVVVGAHLDSWDLGQGTTDNGTGTCVVLEAARLLKRCGTPPRRTIRFILFTGEEEGLHGSKQYVQAHKDEMAKVSLALVHDTGTGKVTGFYMGNRSLAAGVLETELASLKELGVKEFAPRSMNGSDHASFERAGVPGLAVKQEPATYGFTHHSQADTLDRAQEAELIQGAQVLAVTAMRVANLDEMLPRGRADKK